MTASPAGAVVSVQGNTILGGDDDAVISVSCAGGVLAAAGSATTGDPCESISVLRVVPWGADVVDLSAVTAAAFPALVNTQVEASFCCNNIVHGSPLDDVMTGRYGNTLLGNAGNDQLFRGGWASGGPGDDVIDRFRSFDGGSGGAGDDRFVHYLPSLGDEGIDGGSGHDSWVVDVAQTYTPFYNELTVTLTRDRVHINFDTHTVTTPVVGVEQVDWTLMPGDVQSFDGAAFPGALEIRGLAGVDTLIGGVADDALYGGGGNDAITGGAGSDVLGGGDDNDTIQARDGVADKIDCGAGTDSVVADAVDVVANCETVNLPPVVTPPVVTPPVAVVPVTGAITGPAKVAKPKKASFKFSSPTAGATFQCKVDGKAWKVCRSPYKVATKKLKLGKHKLLVRAVVGGAVDATPSKKVFKVVRG